MAVSLVSGSPVNYNAATGALGTHAAGDYIFGHAVCGDFSGMPALPAGWTNLVTATSGGLNVRLAYKIAASSSETPGTWTNAKELTFAAYRGVASLGTPQTTTSSSTSMSYPALTLGVVDGSSWGLRCGASGFDVSTIQSGVPAGYTARAGGHVTHGGNGSSSVICDTNGGISSNPTAQTQTVSNTGWSASSIELIAAAVADTTKFFGFF